MLLMALSLSSLLSSMRSSCFFSFHGINIFEECMPVVYRMLKPFTVCKSCCHTKMSSLKARIRRKWVLRIPGRDYHRKRPEELLKELCIDSDDQPAIVPMLASGGFPTYRSLHRKSSVTLITDFNVSKARRRETHQFLNLEELEGQCGYSSWPLLWKCLDCGMQLAQGHEGYSWSPESQGCQIQHQK